MSQFPSSALTLKRQQPSLEVGREPLMTTLSHVSCVPRLPRRGGARGREQSHPVVADGTRVEPWCVCPGRGLRPPVFQRSVPPMEAGSAGGPSVVGPCSPWHPTPGCADQGNLASVRWCIGGCPLPVRGAGGRGAGWQRAGPRQFLLLLSETLAVRRVPFH